MQRTEQLGKTVGTGSGMTLTAYVLVDSPTAAALGEVGDLVTSQDQCQCVDEQNARRLHMCVKDDPPPAGGVALSWLRSRTATLRGTKWHSPGTSRIRANDV